MSQPTETRVKLWEAINLYVVACGGKPDNRVYGNTARQAAVSAVELFIELERTEAQLERASRELSAKHGFTVAEVSQILRNFGIDPECGSCASIAFTGATTAPHTCKSELCEAAGLEVRGG